MKSLVEDLAMKNIAEAIMTMMIIMMTITMMIITIVKSMNGSLKVIRLIPLLPRENRSLQNLMMKNQLKKKKNQFMELILANLHISFNLWMMFLSSISRRIVYRLYHQLPSDRLHRHPRISFLIQS